MTTNDAVITLFRTAMVGALTEDHLRCLLTESGEMRRSHESRGMVWLMAGAIDRCNLVAVPPF
jgi:hypothetical protein